MEQFKSLLNPFSSPVYLIAAISFLVALYFMTVGGRRWQNHEVKRRLCQRWSILTLALASVYLLQLAARFFAPDLLSPELWLYLLGGSALVALALGIYVIWFYATQYKTVLSAYEARRSMREARNKPIGGLLTKENMPMPTGNYPRAKDDKEKVNKPGKKPSSSDRKRN